MSQVDDVKGYRTALETIKKEKKDSVSNLLQRAVNNGVPVSIQFRHEAEEALIKHYVLSLGLDSAKSALISVNPVQRKIHQDDLVISFEDIK